MTILIDKSSNQPISGIMPNGYNIDGIKPVLPNNIIEVEVIDTAQPTITANQNASFKWELTENGWEKVWTVLESEVSDWLHNYPLRIVAPKMHLYCNEIMAEHQGLIEANSEIITVETKPTNQ